MKEKNKELINRKFYIDNIFKKSQSKNRSI